MANDSIGRIAHEMRDAASDVRADDFDAPATLKLWADRLAAIQQAQQPGAQAVGFISRVELQSLDAARGDGANFNATVFARPTGQAGVALYTAPPPLPEGVSEEDVEVAFSAIEAVFVAVIPNRGPGLSPEDMAIVLAGIRAALESYRARLAAKGGVER